MKRGMMVGFWVAVVLYWGLARLHEWWTPTVYNQTPPQKDVRYW